MKSHDTSSTTEKLSIEEQLRKRNAYLQGRVDILQKQNRKLGSCITELRSFTDMVGVLTHAYLYKRLVNCITTVC